MKPIAALALLLTPALAARFTAERWARHRERALARRNAGTSSGFMQPDPSSAASAAAAAAASSGDGANGTAHVSYSTNWAGAVLIGTGYTSVTGTITVPVPHAPAGSSSRTESAASAWVGIDGDTCQTAILQTGVDFYVEGTTASFDAWYEWYPDYAYTFSGFAVGAGDSVRMTVTATGARTGSAVIDNLSTGKSVTHTFGSQSSGALCRENAEWIVEDFQSGSQLVPFADFGSVTFTGASATTASGTVGVSGAEILDIKQNNVVYTECGTSGSSSVYCDYTG